MMMSTVSMVSNGDNDADGAASREADHGDVQQLRREAGIEVGTPKGGKTSRKDRKGRGGRGGRRGRGRGGPGSSRPELIAHRKMISNEEDIIVKPDV